jgi:hypothetical protein
MALINILIFILLTAVIGIMSVRTKYKGIIAVSSVFVVALITSFIAVKALFGNSYETILQGTLLFGPVPVIIDSLSAWFILTINFTLVTHIRFQLYEEVQGEKERHYPALHCFYCCTICLTGNMFRSEWFYLSPIMGIDGNLGFYSCNI